MVAWLLLAAVLGGASSGETPDFVADFAQVAYAYADSSTTSQDEFSLLQVSNNVVERNSKAALDGATGKEQKSSNLRRKQVLTNAEDLVYTGKISVGGQTVRCIFDTGSFELLVFSKRCKSSSCSKREMYFDDTASESFNALNWTKVHSFGSGETLSMLSTDLLSIEPLTSRQAFWMVIDAQMPVLQAGFFESVFGLGYPRLTTDQMESWLEEDRALMKNCSADAPCAKWLYSQLEEDERFYKLMTEHPTFIDQNGINRFSFCFKQAQGSDGIIVWEDHDPKMLADTFREIRVTGQSTWSTDLSDVTLSAVPGGSCGEGCFKWCAGGSCHALLDTGTSLLAVPSQVIDDLWQKLNLTNGDCTNLDGMPDLRFKLGGVEVSMAPQSYIGSVSGDVAEENAQFFPHLLQMSSQRALGCQLLMMSIDIDAEEGGALWIVGMPFFREYYTTFNFGTDHDWSTRSMHVARSDGECGHPAELRKAKQGVPTFLERTNVGRRHLDISKVHVPAWVRAAANNGGKKRI